MSRFRAKPHSDLSGEIRQTPKRTDGTFGVSAVPASSTRKPRTYFRRSKLSPDIDRERLDTLPPDAKVYVNGNRQIKMVTYHRAPERPKPKPARDELQPDERSPGDLRLGRKVN
jgi:hypothetical protein